MFPIEFAYENQKRVYVKVRLRKNYILVSQPTLPIEIRIRNPNNVVVSEVEVNLRQHRQLGEGGSGDETIVSTTLPGIVDFQGAYLHDTFPIHILAPHTRLLPTHDYVSAGDMSGSHWTIDYTLEIVFHIGGLFTNINFNIPIIVSNARK